VLSAGSLTHTLGMITPDTRYRRHYRRLG